MSEVYYEVHTISVLHTAKINNVNSISIMYVIMFSIMFINRIRDMVSFELGKEIKKDVNSSCHEREKILSRILTQNYFLCLTFVTRRETPFFISLLSSNLTISLNLFISLFVIIYLLICRVGFIIEEVRNINCSHLHLNYISQCEQQVAKL